MTHGTRQTYRTGCHCTPCRAANAAYIAHLRQLHAVGRKPLGALLSGAEAQRYIKALRIERFSRAEIARRLGLKSPKLRLDTPRLRYRSVLRLRRLYRENMAEGEQE